MITLEQVKLLETKVTRAIEYVKTVTEENSLLRGKLDSCQKRVDELELVVQSFKEDQNRIEDGIRAALDRLNQFEDAIEGVLSPGGSGETPPAPPVERTQKKQGPVKPAPVPEEEEKEKTGDSGQDSGELDIF